MNFKADCAESIAKHVAYICTCQDMASRLQSMVGRSTSKMTYTGRPWLYDCPMTAEVQTVHMLLHGVCS